MGLLSFLFGSKSSQTINYIQKDAVILDVRTQSEWNAGHIENSIHIPINDLTNRIDEITSLNKPVITCCASGVRSAKAAKILKLKNVDAINGGGWVSVKNKL